MELCENTYSVYDSFVYPQVSRGYLERFLSLIFKEPDRKDEGQLCFEIYLGEYFLPKLLSSDDIMLFYSKLSGVFNSLMSSKKVNTKNIKSPVTIQNVFGETFEEVYESKDYDHHALYNDCRCLLTDHIIFWLTHKLTLNAFFSV